VAEKPAAEKTEQPTTKRLQKAKREGRVVQSEELPAVVSIIVLVMVLVVFSPTLLQWFVTQMKEGMSGQVGIFTNNKTFINFLNVKITDTLSILFPIFVVLIAGGIVSCVAVSGFNFSTKSLAFNFDAINPVKGFGKLFNIRSVVKLGISIAKMIFISIIVWRYFQDKVEDLAAIRWAWSSQIIVAMAKIILGALIRVCVAIIVIAAVEVAFQKWKYRKDMMMTKQEIKQERKDTEGSPEVKVRVRRIQIEMARKRMLKDVPKANVVLVNPTHVAVALRYDAKTMNAPIMVAKGADNLAEKIREIARAYGVPIVRRPELARAIYATVRKSGDPIPNKLYAAVAEVLAMIYRMKRSRRRA